MFYIYLYIFIWLLIFGMVRGLLKIFNPYFWPILGHFRRIFMYHHPTSSYFITILLNISFGITTILWGCSFHPHGHQQHRSKKLYLCQFYLIFLLEFHHPKIFHLCSIVCWNYFPPLHHRHHLNFYICVQF